MGWLGRTELENVYERERRCWHTMDVFLIEIEYFDLRERVCVVCVNAVERKLLYINMCTPDANMRLTVFINQKQITNNNLIWLIIVFHDLY